MLKQHTYNAAGSLCSGNIDSDKSQDKCTNVYHCFCVAKVSSEEEKNPNKEFNVKFLPALIYLPQR